MTYYLHIILAIADARYQEAYWDQVYQSELWLAALNELILESAPIHAAARSRRSSS